MSTRIKLDWDLCAACFSFDAQGQVTRRALSAVLKSMYNHANDIDKQREDIQKVGAYMTGPLKSLLTKFHDRIDIVTANSEANVRQLCVYFGLPQPANIVSIFDRKAVEFNRVHGANISPNLFAAAVEHIKKVPKKKTSQQVADKFHVTVESITGLLQQHSEAIMAIDAAVTKAAHLKASGAPFIFLDDSMSEIRSAQGLFSTAPAKLFNATADFLEGNKSLQEVASKHKMNPAEITAAIETYPEIADIVQMTKDGNILYGKAAIVPIPRPKRNAPVEECGMFGAPAEALFGKASWEQFLDEKLSILDLCNVRTYTLDPAHFRTLVISDK